MKVFLTGATGILGRHIAAGLVEGGYSIVALERGANPERRKKTPFHDQIEWIDGHLGDLLSIQKGMEDADFVIHAAALVSFRPGDHKKLMQVNVEGTANIVNCALKAPKLKKLIHISSVASLSPGRTLPAEVIEKQGFNPDDDTSDYARSKYMAELEIFRGVEEGLKAAMVNPSIILADGDANESSASLLHYVKKENLFYPTGWINVVDVRDVARAAIRLLQSGPEDGSRLILSAECMPYKTFLDMAAGVLGCRPPQIKAGKALSEIAWRLLAFLSVFQGKKPLLTRFTARASARKLKYSSIFLENIWPDFRFTPILETLKWIAGTHTGKTAAGEIR